MIRYDRIQNDGTPIHANQGAATLQVFQSQRNTGRATKRDSFWFILV